MNVYIYTYIYTSVYVCIYIHIGAGQMGAWCLECSIRCGDEVFVFVVVFAVDWTCCQMWNKLPASGAWRVSVSEGRRGNGIVLSSLRQLLEVGSSSMAA